MEGAYYFRNEYALYPRTISSLHHLLFQKFPYEQARYGSSDVRLFITTDARTFGQVRRALIRALEQCKSAGH